MPSPQAPIVPESDSPADKQKLRKLTRGEATAVTDAGTGTDGMNKEQNATKRARTMDEGDNDLFEQFEQLPAGGQVAILAQCAAEIQGE